MNGSLAVTTPRSGMRALAMAGALTLLASTAGAQDTARTRADTLGRTAAWADGRAAGAQVPIGGSIGTAFVAGAMLPVGMMVMPIPLAAATSVGLAYASQQATPTDPPPELRARAAARGDTYLEEFREGYASKLRDRRATAGVFTGLLGAAVGVGIVICCLLPNS